MPVDADWTPLRRALAICRGTGTVPQVWWRDDDAIAPTPALDTLVALSNEIDLPVHLAVIPAHATRALAAYSADAPLIPVVHGWAHADHSAPEDKKNEFLTPRPDAIPDAAMGLERMKDLFGDKLRTMFVPPWNRVHADVVRALPGMGYTALSTYGPRAAPSDGLARINTHVDPIDWKGTRGLINPQTLIDDAARQLATRNAGQSDATEPFGLLTHHLVHDAAIWDFSRTFLNELLQGGATPWQMET